MAEDEGFPSVDLYYDGVFIPNPLVYFNYELKSIRDLDFKAMSWSDFKRLIGSLAESSLSTERIYFCPAQERFSNGLNALQNDCDYYAFLETAYEGKQLVNLYIDYMDEPLFEWLEKEDPESDNEAVEMNDEEDVDSQLYDNEKWEHEEDEEVVSIKRTTNDHFLNKLCPIEFEDEEDEGPQRTVFPVHDATKDWKEMTPVIGMKFANPVLKFSLSNYAVANGYDLYYEKNDKDRLLVKCCKNRIPSCPFRLWASWMKNERTFQIKSLQSEHTCGRAFKLGSIITYKWIGTHYVNEILQRPKLSLRKMKSEISMKYNLNVTIGQCRNAKKFCII